jgi:hypothetical protein
MLRRILACALALLVLLETGGIARAMRAGGEIECCCGTHSAVRPCHCKDCPVVARRAPHAEQCALHSHECDGQSDDGAGVLSTVAFPITSARPSPITFTTRVTLTPAIALIDRLTDPQRPPP